MREREVLAIAKNLGIYDRKMDFVEISPDELLRFADALEEHIRAEFVTKLHTMVEKL